jgi:small conductance mechanosensitive channel
MLSNFWADFDLWWLVFWGKWHTLIRIVLILVGALVIRQVLLALVKRTVKQVVSGANGKADRAPQSPLANARIVQRAKTLGSVLSNLITWTMVVSAIAAVLSELGVAVGAIVAGAGIVGAAIGFGAQSLVRDLISGLFIVFEDQYGVGDSVDLGQASGVVESVGLRVTQVRDVTGTLWYVRNGEVVRVGNQSQGWSRVVLDIALPYDSRVDKAQAAILKAANGLVKDPNFGKQMLGEPEVWGIEAISGEQLVLRLVQQVAPVDADAVARELRSRIKVELDAAKLRLADSRHPIYVEVAGKPITGKTTK